MGLPKKRAGLFGPPAKAENTRETLRRLWHYLGHQKSQLLLVSLTVLISSVFMLIGPYLIGKAVDTMASGKGGVNFGDLSDVALLLLGTYLAAALTGWIQVYLMAIVAQRTIRDLRKDLFGKLQELPLNFFDSRPDGEIMSRLTNDVEALNNTLSHSATHIISSLITLAGSIILMLYLSTPLTVITLIAIPLGILGTTRIAKRSRNFFSGQQKELGRLNGLIEETISGQPVVKAFGREGQVIEEFSTVSTRLKQVGIKAQIVSGMIMPVMNVVNNLSFALVAFAGGWMALKGIITVGVIASFLTYSRQFARPLNEMANQFNMFQAALAGAERVFEVMDEASEFVKDKAPSQLQKVAGEVVFDQVTFGYNSGQPIIKNISLHAKPGDTIALVGPTGAGKTTVVNLLMRFYDVDQGKILIDGQDIRSIEKDSLRGHLGMVLQDSYLFSATIRENIRYGRLSATDEEVEKAARLANAEAFIHRLPAGYDTVLTDEGGNISQGQRQLLTIARAILADPAILILDEATSSVDTRTEMQIQQAMLSLMKGRTSFVIAHRLSTIRRADQILVIDQGQIIEHGTHEQLLADKGFYYNLYNSQFTMTSSQ